MLSNLEAVESTSSGFRAKPERLFDLYPDRTRPRVSNETHWYSTRPLLDQAKTITRLPRSEEQRIGFSADLGPDLLAP